MTRFSAAAVHHLAAHPAAHHRVRGEAPRRGRWHRRDVPRKTEAVVRLATLLWMETGGLLHVGSTDLRIGCFISVMRRQPGEEWTEDADDDEHEERYREEWTAALATANEIN